MIVKSTKAKLTEIEAPRGGAGLMNCLGYLTDEQLSNNMKGFNFILVFLLACRSFVI